MSLKQRFRKSVQKLHLAVDGILGRIISSKPSLKRISQSVHQSLSINDMDHYAYSKSTHFSNFHILPIHKNQSLATCDLKVYQDSFTYTFIKDNIPEGATILEIGGGESRIIKTIRNHYTIWNLDKLQGSGFGPTDLLDEQGFHLVRDYIGTFSPELPTGSFDLVYSISTVEHFSKDPNEVQAIIEDMNRLLKPGGYCLHCVDAILYEDHYFVHPLVERIIKLGFMDYSLPTFNALKNDSSLWTLPPFAFYTRWYHLVKQPMRKFGHPFSINLVWQK